MKNSKRIVSKAQKEIALVPKIRERERGIGNSLIFVNLTNMQLSHIVQFTMLMKV